MGQNGLEQNYSDEYGGSILGECPFKAKSQVTVIDFPWFRVKRGEKNPKQSFYLINNQNESTKQTLTGLGVTRVKLIQLSFHCKPEFKKNVQGESLSNSKSSYSHS